VLTGKRNTTLAHQVGFELNSVDVLWIIISAFLSVFRVIAIYSTCEKAGLSPSLLPVRISA